VIASGFSAEGSRMLVFSLAYLLLGLGILRGWWWLGLIAFVLLVLGLFSASQSIGTNSAIPDWSRLLILKINFLASVALGTGLFRHITSNPNA
jgi:hypothetical protein